MLRTGFFAGGAPLIMPTFTYRDWKVSTSNLTSYTFSVNLGPEFPGRRIVVNSYVGNGASLTIIPINTVTVNGVPLTIHDQDGENDNKGGNSMSWALSSGIVETGTTVNVTHTLPQSPTCSAVAVYALADAYSEPIEIQKQTSEPIVNFPLSSHPPETILIGGFCTYGGNNLTVSSDGVSQPNYDGGGTMQSSRFSSAFSMVDCSGSPTIRAQVNSTEDECAFVSVWAGANYRP